MPNLYSDAGFEPDEEEISEENVSDFDLIEDADNKVPAPIFDSAAGDLSLASIDDEEAGEDEELTPILAKTIADKDENEELEEDEENYLEEAEEKAEAEDCVIIPKERIALARKLIENIRENSSRLSTLCGDFLGDSEEERIAIAEISDGLIDAEEDGGKIVEGIFNGENMIGPDGKEYSVPANYASKSKLVEGDILKLTITDRGTFIYKQTKPIERRRIIGKLEKDANGNYLVVGEHKKFHVITASITYYKGVPGDKVVILVPVAGDSAWAAVENVIKSK